MQNYETTEELGGRLSIGSYMSYEYLSDDNTVDSNTSDNFSDTDYSRKNSGSIDSNNDRQNKQDFIASKRSLHEQLFNKSENKTWEQANKSTTNEWDTFNPNRYSLDSNMSFEYILSDDDSSNTYPGKKSQQEHNLKDTLTNLHSNIKENLLLEFKDNASYLETSDLEMSMESSFSSEGSSSSISSIHTWEEDYLEEDYKNTELNNNNIVPKKYEHSHPSNDSSSISIKSSWQTESTNSTSEHSRMNNLVNKDNVKTTTKDKIGCFNINKQYSHECTAELMMKGQFACLSLQEPFSSNTTCNKSWASYRTANLASANFKAFETKHQILIIDEEKWGGKNLEEVQCFQEGRIMAIPIHISKKQTLGIISIYAITGGNETLANGIDKGKIRTETTEIVNGIYDKWIKKFPCIIILLMGDMQETWSTSNLDNFGLYRKENYYDGIINSFRNSHFSIVRNERECAGQHYWTRRGRIGSRGIDHILLPNSTNIAAWNFKGYLEETLSMSFYNSDHTLLSCTFDRWEPNEERKVKLKTKFLFNKIYNIHIKDDLSFDDSRFKCDALFDQEKLYIKLHELTHPSNEYSKNLMLPLDNKINTLIKELWDLSCITGQDGKDNNLLEIHPTHATKLEEITTDFKALISDLMHSMKLTSDTDDTNNAALKRNGLKDR